MTWMTLGSLALPHQLNRHSVALRGDLARLSVEMSTGRTGFVSSHLRGDLSALAAIESRTRRIDAESVTARSAATDLASAQNALSTLAGIASTNSASLLSASAQGQDAIAVQTAASAAGLALAGAREALSTQVAGRALFSGVATDRAPLVDVSSIMGVLAPLVAGATSAEQVSNAINQAFLAPGAEFEALFFQGGGESGGVFLNGEEQSAALPTASSPALRRLLAGLAMAAFAGDQDLALTHGQRQDLARRAALTLAEAGSGITALQAVLGESEARIDAAKERLHAERSALDLARDSLIGVDPFEAAGKLQEAQTRLEVLYAVTARTARLSLLEYIR